MVPSGPHEGVMLPPFPRTTRRWPEPSAFITTMSSPRTQTMCLPSGDQCGPPPLASLRLWEPSASITHTVSVSNTP